MLIRQRLTLGLALLAVLILPTAAAAEERAKIEIVPTIPHVALDGMGVVAFSPDGARLVSGGARVTSGAATIS